MRHRQQPKKAIVAFCFDSTDTHFAFASTGLSSFFWVLLEHFKNSILIMFCILCYLSPFLNLLLYTANVLTGLNLYHVKQTTVIHWEVVVIAVILKPGVQPVLLLDGLPPLLLLSPAPKVLLLGPGPSEGLTTERTLTVDGATSVASASLTVLMAVLAGAAFTLWCSERVAFCAVSTVSVSRVLVLFWSRVQRLFWSCVLVSRVPRLYSYILIVASNLLDLVLYGGGMWQVGLGWDGFAGRVGG